MADKSHIEWTDATWNPVTGCSIVSPGCTHCYAMKLAGGRLRNHPSRAGLTTTTKNGPVWNGTVRFNEGWLLQPLQWKKPRMIFVCAHGDLFHEDVPDDWIDQVFAVMALAPQHTYQVLTKRSARMRAYFSIGTRDAVIDAARGILRVRHEIDIRAISWDLPAWPLPNVWLGVSTERQQEADLRISDLEQTPAAIRFISYEPALGPIDLKRWMPSGKWGKRPGTGELVFQPTYFMTKCEHCAWHGSSELCHLSHNWDDADVVCPSCNKIFMCDDYGGKLDWVIAGGESGDGARPMHPDWARSLRDQCQGAGVPFFFKQWGNIAPLKAALPVLEYEGRSLHTAWPDGSLGRGNAVRNGGPGIQLFLGAKAICGRHLDGVLHNAMPVRL